MRLGELAEVWRTRDILKNTFRGDKRRAQYVAPVKYNRTKTGFRIVTITKIPGERARAHEVLIDMPEGYSGSFTRAPSIKILCDCGQHKFTYNWALNQKDAAIEDVTNGEPPDIKNPTYSAGSCKHGVVALEMLNRFNPDWQPPVRAPKSTGKKISLTDLDTMLRRVRRGRV